MNDFYPLYIYFLKYGAYFVKRRTFDLIEMHSIALLYIYWILPQIYIINIHETDLYFEVWSVYFYCIIKHWFGFFFYWTQHRRSLLKTYPPTIKKKYENLFKTLSSYDFSYITKSIIKSLKMFSIAEELAKAKASSLLFNAV